MDIALAAILGTVLSLLFTFVPQLKDWFEKLDSRSKSQIMAFSLLIIGAAVTGLSCAGFITAVVCTQTGVWTFITTTLLNAVLALNSNQATYLITKSFKPQSNEGVG